MSTKGGWQTNTTAKSASRTVNGENTITCFQKLFIWEKQRSSQAMAARFKLLGTAKDA